MVNTTHNAESEVDAQAFTVRRSIRIAASRERVWTAITEPKQISRWFGDALLEGSGPGSTGSLSWPDHGSTAFRVEAVDEPNSISYRWNSKPSNDTVITDASTVFTFTLEADGEATRLTVVETGFDHTDDPAAQLESHRGGWNSELDELVALLEGAA